jgi:Skp family chaperone for outer membrane proteins
MADAAKRIFLHWEMQRGTEPGLQVDSFSLEKTKMDIIRRNAMDYSVCKRSFSGTRLRVAALTMVLALSCAATVPAKAQTAKEKKRCAYVMKQTRMTQATCTKFAPLFMAYQKELKAAKAGYDNLKDKLKSSIKANRLTDAQARQLLEAHWTSDEKEVAVRRRYTATFTRLIGAKATYNVFRFANDKEATK